MYLVLYDAYSIIRRLMSYRVLLRHVLNYPKVEELLGTSAQEAIRKMSSIFARHEVSFEVLCDNKPQFA